MPRPKRQKVNGDMSQGSSSAHAWADLPSQLTEALPKASKAAKSDGQLDAFTTSNAIDRPATFAIKSAGSDNAVLVTVTNGKAEIRSGDNSEALFTLSALPEQWQEFFKQTPVAPYQSYWGVRRQLVKMWKENPADLSKMFGMNLNKSPENSL